MAKAETDMESIHRLFQDLESCDTWKERDRCEEQCLRALKGLMKSTALKLKGEGDKKVMGNVILQVFLFHIDTFGSLNYEPFRSGWLL